MPLRRRFAALLILIALCATATAVSAADDTLIWKGDHATGRVIMEDLAKQYAKEKKGTIKLESFSTISGLDAVAQGSADIAGSARGKYDKRPEEAGINFVPVALDAAVLGISGKHAFSAREAERPLPLRVRHPVIRVRGAHLVAQCRRNETAA